MSVARKTPTTLPFQVADASGVVIKDGQEEEVGSKRKSSLGVTNGDTTKKASVVDEQGSTAGAPTTPVTAGKPMSLFVSSGPK